MGGGLSKHPGDEFSKPSPVPPTTSVASAETEKIQHSEPNEETTEESKCPMHKADGSYSYDWTQLFRAASVHGPKGSKPLSQQQQEQAKKPAPEPKGGGCPVKHGSTNAHPEYNVYSQPIDKSNQMPSGVKTQLPSSVQEKELSTNRVSSTIPKGGGDESSGSTWTYPSPQQFYNSLVRKGKLGDVVEDDMESVVALHNNMNEKTWAQVVEWEKQTYSEESTPKLLKFQGRPRDLSPKAVFKHYILGHPLPFDRHDWTVLRDDGTTVRYIIDYYYDETRAQDTPDSALPALHDRNATPSLLVDVRPALDGPEELFARAVQMPYKIWNQQTSFTPLPLKGTPEMASQVQESMKVWQMIQDSNKQSGKNEETTMNISETQAKEIAESFSKILKMCTAKQKKVDACVSEEECMKASVDLTMCMGPIACPVQYQSFVKTLSEDDDRRIEAALQTLSECVVIQDGKRQLAKEQHPSVFQ